MSNHGVLRTTLAVTGLILLLALGARADGEHDRVYPVEPGTHLVVEHVIGTVLIEVWDRDEVHVEADYDDALALDVRPRGLRFNVELSGKYGHQGYGDVAITVPRWMPVEIEGHQIDVEIEGLEAEVAIQVVGGDVFVNGGRGRVEVESVHGSITVHDAMAALDLSSTNEDVELRDCAGEVRVESVNGDVRMEGIDASIIEIETTNGDVLVDGILTADGDYYVSTHSGDVSVSVAPDADVTFTVDAYRGNVRTNHEVVIESEEREKRYRVVFGPGSGRFVIETFDGDVLLYDPKLGRGKRG